MKNTVITFRRQKETKDRITMLTAYDYSTARLLDEAGINAILVGDSLGMVIQGYPDTLSVTMEDMLYHTAAVARGVKDAMIIADMPFMSYQTSVHDAVVNAGRLIKDGRANAVKLEGGAVFADHIRAIVDASIPVVGHLGLTPQSVHVFGGYRVQGKETAAIEKLLYDAKAVEAAGAFAVVLECIPDEVASFITKQLTIPTIGIGAGAACDGQVLVYQDMLGMYSDFTPKFAKKFEDVGTLMKEGFRKFIEETKAGTFPGKEHCFEVSEQVMADLYKKRSTEEIYENC